MKRAKPAWMLAINAASKYSRASHGGPKDKFGQSLTQREGRIYAYAWEQGFRAGKRTKA